jgi:hypothetical protein
LYAGGPIVAGIKPLWDWQRHLGWEVDPLKSESLGIPFISVSLS